MVAVEDDRMGKFSKLSASHYLQLIMPLHVELLKLWTLRLMVRGGAIKGVGSLGLPCSVEALLDDFETFGREFGNCSAHVIIGEVICFFGIAKRRQNNLILERMTDPLVTVFGAPPTSAGKDQQHLGVGRGRGGVLSA